MLRACGVLYIFDLWVRLAPQRRAIYGHLNFKKWSEHAVFCPFWPIYTCAWRHSSVRFLISALSTWLRTRRFSKPTFQLSGTANHLKKHSAFGTFLTFRAIVSSFFWLSHNCNFFLLTLLLCSAFQLSILSEVSLLNFLRSRYIYIYISRSMSFESCFVRVNETFANLQASHKILGWSNKFGDIGHRKEGEVQVQDIQTSGMRKAGWLMSKHPWVKERCESKRICLPITLAFSPLFFLLQCQTAQQCYWFREKKTVDTKTSANKWRNPEEQRAAPTFDHLRSNALYFVLYWTALTTLQWRRY